MRKVVELVKCAFPHVYEDGLSILIPSYTVRLECQHVMTYLCSSTTDPIPEEVNCTKCAERTWAD